MTKMTTLQEKQIEKLETELHNEHAKKFSVILDRCAEGIDFLHFYGFYQNISY